MIKPVYGIGGPLTDANFNIMKMSKKQVQALADKKARKTLKDGLSDFARGFVFDAGDYYRISVCVTNPGATS